MTQAFSRVHFIMVEPSHPGNVGSAARAIKTMGFSQLSLVAPHAPTITRHPDAIALASGAVDVLANARVYDTLEAALQSITLAFALTARPRHISPPACDIRLATTFTCNHLADYPTGAIAFVVGTERSGLSNTQIALCQRLCYIPANPQYSSLNVAQALQLAAWEVRYALLAAAQTALPTAPLMSTVGTTARSTAQDTLAAGSQPASSEALQALLVHWEEALIAIQFLDPGHPKKLMLRMRCLFNRSVLTRDEVNMLRGICTTILATAHKTAP